MRPSDRGAAAALSNAAGGVMNRQTEMRSRRSAAAPATEGSPAQALLYRLLGDRNPAHVDPRAIATLARFHSAMRLFLVPAAIAVLALSGGCGHKPRTLTDDPTVVEVYDQV